MEDHYTIQQPRPDRLDEEFNYEEFAKKWDKRFGKGSFKVFEAKWNKAFGKDFPENNS